MSPYMQQVVDQQMASAQRQADIAGTQRGAQAVRAGAFGGSRQAIENAEANRALAKALTALGKEDEAKTRLERIATIEETICDDEKAA
jgi:hypothetical protein